MQDPVYVAHGADHQPTPDFIPAPLMVRWHTHSVCRCCELAPENIKVARASLLGQVHAATSRHCARCQDCWPDSSPLDMLSLPYRTHSGRQRRARSNRREVPASSLGRSVPVLPVWLKLELLLRFNAAQCSSAWQRCEWVIRRRFEKPWGGSRSRGPRGWGEECNEGTRMVGLPAPRRQPSILGAGR